MRHTGRQTETDRERETNKQHRMKSGKQRCRQRYGQTDRQKDIYHIGILTYRQKYRKTDRQTDR